MASTVKKAAICILLLSFAFICLISCEGRKDYAEALEINVVFKSGDDNLGSVKGNAEQMLAKNGKTKWVMAVPNEGFEFKGWSDGVTDIKREGESFGEDTVITAQFGLPASEIPLFSLNMPSGNEVDSKTEYTDITLSVSNTDKELCITDAPGRIRGRGNATWKMEKKSYRLKMNEKINLLGQGKGPAKDWILLANHCDQTLLRNYIAFKLGSELDNIEHTSSVGFCEVMINGVYKGVYLLCEQIEVDPYRVNIEVDPNELDTGYLIELDQYADDDLGNEEGVTYFKAAGQMYTVKSDATREQMDFIKAFVSEVDSAVMDGDREKISAVMDIPSAIDMYLLHEYMLNVDVGWSSFFLYKKPGEKLYFGPPWDFDLAAGNDKRMWNGGSEGIYVADGGGFNYDQENKWFIALNKQKWFRDEVYARWEEVKGIFEEASSVAEKTANSMKTAIDRNFERWNIFGRRINQEPDGVVFLSNYRQHSKHLFKWLSDRYTWLDSYYQTNYK